MDTARTGRVKDIALMDGEEVETVLDLANGMTEGEVQGSDCVVLTNRRLIHLRGNGSRRRATLASLKDVQAVEVVVQADLSAFVWGGLALVIALVLWRTVDNPIGSVVSAVVVALMGIYLIVDQIVAPGVARLLFRVGGSEIRCDLKGESALEDAYPFVNRLFQLKEREASPPSPTRRPFAPR